MVGGSQLYNLDTAESDTDYVGMFAHPPDVFLGIQKPSTVPDTLARVAEDASGDEDDYVFHEVGKVARLLLKGNFQMVELLHASLGNPVSGSWGSAWGALVAMANAFVSRAFISNYIGFLTMLTTRHAKWATRREEPKKWYNIYRGLYVVGAVLAGRSLPVRLDPDHPLDGPAIQRLMAIKSGNEDQSALAEEAFETIAAYKAHAPYHILPESPDRSLINQWVLDVRHGVFAAQDALSNPQWAASCLVHPHGDPSNIEPQFASFSFPTPTPTPTPTPNTTDTNTTT